MSERLNSPLCLSRGRVLRLRVLAAHHAGGRGLVGREADAPRGLRGVLPRRGHRRLRRLQGGGRAACHQRVLLTTAQDTHECHCAAAATAGQLGQKSGRQLCGGGDHVAWTISSVPASSNCGHLYYQKQVYVPNVLLVSYCVLYLGL